MSIPVYPRNIKWRSELKSYLHTINSGIVFSFLSRNCEQVHTFTSCKDYLHDMVFAQINQWSGSWCNYTVGNSPEISTRQMRMISTNTSDRALPEKAENALGFLHDMEKKFGVKTLSRLYRAKNPPDCYLPVGAFIFIGDPIWMSCGPMISLYALGIRLGYGTKPGDEVEEVMQAVADRTRDPYSRSDISICQAAIHGVRRLIAEKPKAIFKRDLKDNYPSGNTNGNTHSPFGIAGFSIGSPKQSFNLNSWYPDDWKAPKIVNVW